VLAEIAKFDLGPVRSYLVGTGSKSIVSLSYIEESEKWWLVLPYDPKS
jgi:hypothetical protein